MENRRPTASRNRVARVLICLGLLALALPGSASADRDLGSTQLKPASTRPAGGGQVKSAPANYDFTCTTPWAPIANQPSGYAIGNCLSGVHQHSQSVSDPVDGTAYLGGYFYGNFNGCGWINVIFLSLVKSQTYNQCPAGSIGHSPSEFMSYSDGCSGTSDCAGTPIPNSGYCAEYANVRPWLSGQAALDPLPASRIVPPNAWYNGAPQLAWRYVTKYATTEGWGKWVMVRDRAHTASGDGTWVFVPKICITALP